MVLSQNKKLINSFGTHGENISDYTESVYSISFLSFLLKGKLESNSFFDDMMVKPFFPLLRLFLFCCNLIQLDSSMDKVFKVITKVEPFMLAHYFDE